MKIICKKCNGAGYVMDVTNMTKEELFYYREYQELLQSRRFVLDKLFACLSLPESKNVKWKNARISRIVNYCELFNTRHKEIGQYEIENGLPITPCDYKSYGTNGWAKVK